MEERGEEVDLPPAASWQRVPPDLSFRASMICVSGVDDKMI